MDSEKFSRHDDANPIWNMDDVPFAGESLSPAKSLEKKIDAYEQSYDALLKEHGEKLSKTTSDLERAELNKSTLFSYHDLIDQTFNDFSSAELSVLRLRQIESIEHPLIGEDYDKEHGRYSSFYNHDRNFHKSKEYQEYKKGKREAYPEIFTNVDMDEAYKVVASQFEKLSLADFKALAKLKSGGKLKEADLFETESICKSLDIKSPIIEYKTDQKNTEIDGDMDFRANTLTLYSRFSDANEEKVANTIAHEVWHFYQHYQAESGEGRGKSYAINFDQKNYQPADADETAYLNQLVEKEAYLFGEGYENVLAANS